MDEEMSHIYTMKYYSNNEINDIMKFKDKWLELENNNPEWGNLDPER